jgi:hypothetical protein
MKKESLQLQEIDDFLSGTLKPEHVAEFERRIAEEQGIRDEVLVTKKVIEGIQASAFREMLKDVHNRIVANNGTGENLK